MGHFEAGVPGQVAAMGPNTRYSSSPAAPLDPAILFSQNNPVQRRWTLRVTPGATAEGGEERYAGPPLRPL